MRFPQYCLPLRRCLLRHHLDVVHRARGGSRRRRTAVHIRRAQRAARRGYDELGPDCIIGFGMSKGSTIKRTMKYYGVRTLTTSPGACPWVATRRRCRRPSWHSPEGGSFPSWTLRPPQMGRPSFSCLPRLGGGDLFSSSSFPWEECTSDTSDDESDRTTLRRRPFRVPVASSGPSFPAPRKVPESASSLEERLQDLRAGGAGQSSRFVVFIQSC